MSGHPTAFHCSSVDVFSTNTIRDSAFSNSQKTKQNKTKTSDISENVRALIDCQNHSTLHSWIQNTFNKPFFTEAWQSCHTCTEHSVITVVLQTDCPFTLTVKIPKLQQRDMTIMLWMWVQIPDCEFMVLSFCTVSCYWLVCSSHAIHTDWW